MKTAKEWLREWFDRDVDIPPLTGFIQDIQSDALLHAASLCRERYPNTFAAKSRAYAAESCAQSIEFEADKLKT